MKIKIKIIFFVVIGLLFIGMAYFGQKSVYARIHNSIITTGTVTKKDHTAKGNNYVAYVFVVDGKEYFGSMPIKFCNECEKRCCVIGSEVKVRYEKGNPNNNDLIH